MIPFIQLSNQNYNLNSIGYFIIAIIILILAYQAYQSYYLNISQQRLWKKSQLPSGRELQVYVADVFGHRNDMFIIGKTIYDKNEDIKVKKDAILFFKNQFGVNDNFLLTYMYPVQVNPNIGYHLQYSQSSPGYNGKIRDGGYTCFVPKGYRLYGNYGGNSGIVIDKDCSLVYGHYLIGDKYKIRYWSLCPLKTYSTYDGDYTPIDCDVEIEHSPEPNLIGLKGKSHGIYIKMKLIQDQTKPLETDHIVIRNVLTFI